MVTTRKNPVVTLDKSYQSLSNKELQEIMIHIRKAPEIKELNLKGCFLDIFQVNIIAEGLKFNESLTKLNLEQNNLSLASLRSLFKVIPTTNLTEVLFSFNADFGDGVHKEWMRKIKLEAQGNQTKHKTKQPSTPIANVTPPSEPAQPNSGMLSTVATAMSQKLTETVEWWLGGKSRKISITVETVQNLQKQVDKNEAKVQALETHVNEHEAKLTEYEKNNKKSVDYLRLNLSALTRMIDRENHFQYEDKEKQALLSDPDLKNYYLALLRHLTGTWLGCMTISSGCVTNGMQFNSDYVSKALDGIGGCIPGVNIATLIISSVIQAVNTVEKNKLVANMTQFFDDFESAIQIIKKTAFALTKAQSDLIKNTKMASHSGIKNKAKKWFNQAKNWALKDGSDNPVVVLALADAAKLLEEIMSGSLKKTEDINELVKVITGEIREVKKQNAGTDSTTALIVSMTRRRSSSGNLKTKMAEMKDELDKTKQLFKEIQQQSEQSKLAAREALDKVKKLEDQQGIGGTQVLLKPTRNRGETLYGDEQVLFYSRVNKLAAELAATQEMVQEMQLALTTHKLQTKR